MGLTPQRRRLALATLSTLVTAAVAAPLVRSYVRSSEEEPVLVVDTTKELSKLLTEEASGDRPDGVTSEGSGAAPELILRPMDEETAKRFFPGIGRGTSVYDELAYMVRTPNWDSMRKWAEHPEGAYRVKTNSSGFYEDEDVRTTGVDVRIVVLGDSHTDGVVSNPESFANRLEAQLGEALSPRVVDVINAGVGGTTFYNYLGMLERTAELSPDLYVVAVYGGNDFAAAVKMRRYFEKAGPWEQPGRIDPKRKEAWERSGQTRPQETQQIRFFEANPDLVEYAIGAGNAVLARMDERARELGGRLVVAYLPPALAAQPVQYERYRAAADEVLEGKRFGIDLSDRLGDAMLAFCEAQGIACVDLRPSFQSAEKPLYWYKDLHINIDGHQQVADDLLPVVLPLVE